MPTASASTLDLTTRGDWIGVYGQEGYRFSSGSGGSSGADPILLPAWITSATVSGSANRFSFTSPAPSGDARALQEVPPTTGRQAKVWFFSTAIEFSITPVSPSLEYKVSIYTCDWDSSRGLTTWDVRNPVGGAVLDSRSLSQANYRSGAYVSWLCTGTIAIRGTFVSTGSNIVANGLFFDLVATTSPGRLISRGAGADGLISIS